VIEIQDVLVRYARALDWLDDEMLRTAFFDDAEIDYGFFRGSFREFAPILMQHLCLEESSADGIQRLEPRPATIQIVPAFIGALDSCQRIQLTQLCLGEVCWQTELAQIATGAGDSGMGEGNGSLHFIFIGVLHPRGRKYDTYFDLYQTQFWLGWHSFAT
jgi:hypothetical protein